jgi:hypothetical protein
MWSWRGAWPGGGQGEETVGCKEEFGVGKEGGVAKRFELKFRWNDWTRVGRSEVWFDIFVWRSNDERSEDFDLEEVELERVEPERSLRSLRIKILQCTWMHHYQQLPTELNNAINQASWHFPS